MTIPVAYFADTKSWEALSGGAGSLDDIYGRLAVDNTWEGYQYFNGNAEVNGGSGSYLWVHTGGAAGGCEIDVEAMPGSIAKLAFFTGPSSSLRWVIGKNATAESAGNVGSDLDIEAYHGGSTFIGTALSIKRSTMAATFGRSILTAGVTGGDKGVGTINATALYEAGTALSAKYAPITGSGAYQPLDADLTALAALAFTDNNFIVGNGTTWVVESGATARTSLGLGTAAVQNTGTSGANVPLMSTANTWALAQTFTAAPVFTDQSGSRTALGLGTMATQAASAVAITGGTWITTTPATPTISLGGGAAAADYVPIQIYASSGVNTGVWLDMSPSGNPNVRSAQIGGVNRAGSNDADLVFRTSQGGVAAAERGYFRLGLVVGAPTGTDKGAGSANAVTLWENGTALTAKYGQLASANTWTANQTISLSNPDLILNKAASTNIAVIDFQTGTSLRWRIGSNATAEGGANAGSDFDILARTDAGAALSTPISIARSSGIMTLSAVPVAAGYQVQTGGYNARASDADNTLTVRTSCGTYEKYTGTLTALRTVTLSTTGAVAGDRFVITRTGGGAFNLNIGTGPLKALATNQWCIVVYDGAAWYLAAYGAL